MVRPCHCLDSEINVVGVEDKTKYGKAIYKIGRLLRLTFYSSHFV